MFSSVIIGVILLVYSFPSITPFIIGNVLSMFVTFAVICFACPFIVYSNVKLPFWSNTYSLLFELFVICISAFVFIVAFTDLFVMFVSEYSIVTGFWAIYSFILLFIWILANLLAQSANNCACKLLLIIKPALISFCSSKLFI